MNEEEIEQQPEQEDTPQEEKRKSRFFSKRKLLTIFGALVGLLVILIAVAFIFYKSGSVDSYVKNQFKTKMEEIGVNFDADLFQLTASPFELRLRNATFNDKLTGEKLFFVREARLGLSVKDLYAWQLSRDVSIDSTEISGAEAWVKFDENGNSNFANLKLVEDEAGSAVNFKYQSINFKLTDSVVHFGDISRKISANANEIMLSLEPENLEVPDEEKRYKINFTSKNSEFTYDEKKLETIDIKLTGIADNKGADITEFRVTTPIGESFLAGNLTDWSSPKYDLTIESTVDLTQTTSIFPLGTSITGVGNFKGKVTGQGENYNIDGNIDAAALTAEGVYLKGVNVAATVAGTNSNYEANGTAVAEMLTFEDFKIDFPKLTGNVRGTGTDFRWVGELQAVAVKTDAINIAGLFIKDAVAEMKDKELTASAGNGRAQKFAVSDNEFVELQARNLKFALKEDGFDISSPNAQANSFNTEDFKMGDIKARDLNVKNRGKNTEITAKGLTANKVDVDDTRVSDITASDFKFTDKPGSIELNAKNLKASRVNADGAVITGLETPDVSLVDKGNETIIYTDKLRVAKIEAGGAIVGTLNIAGVRLTVRQGVIEGRSNDIDAGDVLLAKNSTFPDGGKIENVKVAKPVFVLEPSGRYRASADMSLGGGIIGNVPLGAANAAVNVSNDRLELKDLNANVMDGSVTGNAEIALNNRNRSKITAQFVDLDLSKLIALQGGRVIPLNGKTNGNVDLELLGTDYRTTSGNITAKIDGQAGAGTPNALPISGDVRLLADNGLFSVETANLNTEKTRITADGIFDLKNDNSDLNLALRSEDATVVERLFRVLGISPEIESQIDAFNIKVRGNLEFTGKLTGNVTDPTINGQAQLEQLIMNERELGSLAANINVTPLATEINDGKLREADGGELAFNVKIPNGGINNIDVNATLTDIDAANLIAALPLDDTLPDPIKDFNAQTSGVVNITGLPYDAQGTVNISSTKGSVAGQTFNSLEAKAVFNGSLIELENLELRSNEGFLRAFGTYDQESTAFDLDLDGKSIQLSGLKQFIGTSASIPNFEGFADVKAKAVGRANDQRSFNINFDGLARDVVINENPFGEIVFKGNTQDQKLNADVTIDLQGKPQVLTASVDFGNDKMPFTLNTSFNESPLAPFLALVPQLKGYAIGGIATGTVEMIGDLVDYDADGKKIYSTDKLSGSAEFSRLDLTIQDTPLAATEPVSIEFTPNEITFKSAKFAGGGTNVAISGVAAIDEGISNSLSVKGRINLSLLNVIPDIAATDSFFGGFADVSVNLAGPNKTARVTGTAEVQNAGISTFVGSQRITFDRLTGRVLFAGNQAQVEQFTGYLGGGKFTANGGVLLTDSLDIDSFRLGIDGTNVTVPLIEEFLMTGDARLEITGRRTGSTNSLLMRIVGNINAKRGIYTKDIELANVVGSRREGSLSSGGSSSGRAPQLDLTVEGKDALIIRNNIADLTASASLRLTGSTNNPQVTGRITATSGTLFFKRDRYNIQRAVLEFPPNTNVEPVITLQAESEIKGYQIFVSLSGPLTDTDMLSVNLRSSPALPQPDVISLITTGNLSNTESGIPTLAQGGINTAAEVLTDNIINNPARKATDKLFGLNVFEIDPVLSGQTLNPSARLTVGRQINNNLRVTYATNLSQDQNQVLALEYRVSNKLSFVAQYEQRPLSNVTANRDNFSFEVRFRRRF